jgi:hypothetical protein
MCTLGFIMGSAVLVVFTMAVFIAMFQNNNPIVHTKCTD